MAGLANKHYTLLALAVSAVALTGCEWDSTDDEDSASEINGGGPGSKVPQVYAYTRVASHPSCPTSGVRFLVGKDTDRDLVLQNPEVTDAILFCNDTYTVEYGPGSAGDAVSINTAAQAECDQSGYAVAVGGRNRETICHAEGGRSYMRSWRLDDGLMTSIGNYRALTGEAFSIGALVPASSTNVNWSASITNTVTGDVTTTTSQANGLTAPDTAGTYPYELRTTIEGETTTDTLTLEVSDPGPGAPTNNTDGAGITLNNSRITLLTSETTQTKTGGQSLLMDSIVDVPAAFNRYELSAPESKVTNLALELDNLTMASGRATHEEFIGRLESNMAGTTWGAVSQGQPGDDSFTGAYLVQVSQGMTPTELARQILVAGLTDQVLLTFADDDLPAPAAEEGGGVEFWVQVTNKVVTGDTAGLIVQVVRNVDYAQGETIISLNSSPGSIVPLAR